MLKKTPLTPSHAELGAKLVDFASWEMPLHYGSQIEEHHAVRRSAGMFDVSHMLILDMEGEGVRLFLLELLANNVARLKETGKALYTCMLRPDGGVIDDLIVYFLGDKHFRLVVNAATAEKDVEWLQRQIKASGSAVELVPRRDLAMIAVQGPQARATVWRILPGSESISGNLKPFCSAWFGNMLIARTGYTGEDGFELMVPAAAAARTWNELLGAGVKPCGLGARDTLRLEAGMNLYGQDMDESVSPLESGLAWTVDLESERAFVGKPALMSQAPQRRLVGLVLLDKGVLRAHQAVATAHGMGETTSGGFSPTMNRSIALARLPNRVSAGDLVEIEVRGKRLKARVVKPPFVRNGNVLIEQSLFTY